MEAYGSRNIGPARMILSGTPRAIVAKARRPLMRRGEHSTRQVALSGAGGEVSRGER
jgi:hypothetical protein